MRLRPSNSIAPLALSRHKRGMTETSYTPRTPLEAVLRKAMAGVGNEQDVLAELLRGDICVPSAKPVEEDGAGLTPLLTRSQRFDSAMMIIFDDVGRIEPAVLAKAPYSLTVAGDWLVQSIAPDRGIVLFVGPGVGCEFSVDMLAKAREA